MIADRPRSLTSLPYYTHLPRMPLSLDHSRLPPVLNLDVFELCGLLPITADISKLTHGVLTIQPSPEVVAYYAEKQTRFQLIFVVANCYDFKEDKGFLNGTPYAISLIPASKWGHVDECDVRAASSIPLEAIPDMALVYLNYDPFSQGYELFGAYGVLGGLDTFADSIGLVVNGYFLDSSNLHNKDTILLSNMCSASPHIQAKYRQHRINRYFKPFANLQPRKIWGADSPIELFLIQALAAEGLYPQIQTMVFRNGEVFPSFYDMIYQQDLQRNEELVSEVDLFFDKEKLAVFCDSRKHHRSKKAREKDERIDSALGDLGIRSKRIPGAEIVHNLPESVDTVKRALLQG